MYVARRGKAILTLGMMTALAEEGVTGDVVPVVGLVGVAADDARDLGEDHVDRFHLTGVKSRPTSTIMGYGFEGIGRTGLMFPVAMGGLAFGGQFRRGGHHLLR